VSCEHTKRQLPSIYNIAYNLFHDVASRIPRRIELYTLLELDKYCDKKQLSSRFRYQWFHTIVFIARLNALKYDYIISNCIYFFI